MGGSQQPVQQGAVTLLQSVQLLRCACCCCHALAPATLIDAHSFTLTFTLTLTLTNAQLRARGVICVSHQPNCLHHDILYSTE